MPLITCVGIRSNTYGPIKIPMVCKPSHSAALTLVILVIRKPKNSIKASDIITIATFEVTPIFYIFIMVILIANTKYFL